MKHLYVTLNFQYRKLHLETNFNGGLNCLKWQHDLMLSWPLTVTPHATFFPLISSHSTVLKEGDAKRKNDTEHMICDAISS